MLDSVYQNQHLKTDNAHICNDFYHILCPQFGPNRAEIKVASVSFTDESILTSFTLVTENKLLARRTDNNFKITVSFPLDVQVRNQFVHTCIIHPESEDCINL